MGLSVEVSVEAHGRSSEYLDVCPELLALDDGESFGGKVFMCDGSFSWVTNVDCKQTRAKINRAMKRGV
jgi:hypothetical protein